MHQRALESHFDLRMTASEQLRVILETSPAAMVVIDGKGRIHGFGKAAQRLFGYAADEAIGQNVSILMASENAQRHDCYLKRCAETGERRMIGHTRVENARARDGKIFPVEISLGEARSQGTACFVVFLRDVTEQLADRRQTRDMLAELAHASRMSTMEAFATAIAHELNQPLTAIANYAEGLRDLLSARTDIENRQEYVDILDTCSKQAVRAGELLHRLRDFVRTGEPHVELVDADSLIDNSLTLALTDRFRQNVIVERDIAQDLPLFAADRLQAQQVLFNLIGNAFEAMHASESGGHKLRIDARIHDDRHIEFIVEDSGPGIDPAVADRMFENFVTTKGGGLGVGLAICRQIVEANGGSIWPANADKLGGASLHFTLPIGAAQAG